MFELWRRNMYAKVGDVEDAFSRVDDQLARSGKEYRQLEKRIELLEQENASLKERLQAVEATVTTFKSSI